MKIKIINNSKNPLPKYETTGSVGMDLYANNEEPITVIKNKVVKIPTGISIELPKGYEAQIRGRSGLGLKGLCIPNGLGTIDSDYRGEIHMILTNLTDTPFVVKKGMRVAQMVINKYEVVELKEVEDLTSTERGTGGFGHTGV